MSESESPAGAVWSGGKRSAAAVLLLAGVVVPLLAWAVLGVVCYCGGLRNSPRCFSIVFILAPLLPLGLIASPILVVRIIFDWSKYPRGRRYRHALVTIVFAGSLAFVGWCIVLSPVGSPGAAFMRGFRRHVQSRADIAAIRAWLDTADAKAAAVQSGHGEFDRAGWPPPVARLRPRHVWVSPDGDDGRAVRVAWADRPLGRWGIVVGREDMPVPPSDSHERRLPLTAGAYVWSDD